MIRTVFSLLLLAAAAAPAAAQTAATPQLKREVTVSGDIVRIGDLVENAGVAPPRRSSARPTSARPARVPVHAVLDAVRPYGLIAVDARGITEVLVTRAARMFAADDIEARIARALVARNTLGDPKNLKLVFDREVRPIALDAAVTADLAIARMSYDAFSRRFDLTFELGEPGTTRRAWRYTGLALETVEIAVPTRALARGDVVKASDVTIERRPKSELTGEPVALASDVVGLAARRPVRLGQALRTADLMKPELVQKNDMVTLHYEVPGIVADHARQGARVRRRRRHRERAQRRVQAHHAGHRHRSRPRHRHAAAPVTQSPSPADDAPSRKNRMKQVSVMSNTSRLATTACRGRPRLTALLGGCSAIDRLKNVGEKPALSAIENPTAQPGYKPVQMPMPTPQPAVYNPNSLWRNGSRAFFKDQRAMQVGDILTVKVKISDNATIANETQRSRTTKEDSGVTDFAGSKLLSGKAAHACPAAC